MAENYVASGQTTDGVVVGNGDDQRVDGTTHFTVVNQGGTQFVSGTADATTVNAGGQQLSYGGTLTDTVINSVGDQRIYSGIATNTVLNGGVQVIYSGVSQGTIINDGGYQSVVGGNANNSLIGSGGYQEVFGGAQITGSTIESGGVQLIDASTGQISIANDRLLAGGHIRIQGLDDNTNGTITFAAESNTLTVQEGSQTFTIGLSGNYTAANFTASPYGTRAVDITICFCRSTSILTSRGDVAVEHLRVGDIVITHSGRQRPIHWIGSSTAVARGANRPIIVRAGAFLDRTPHRDLRVTRGHSFLFGDVLIPIGELVNGMSICWDEAARTVEVFHVGLDTHDVLVAEGAPAESYRDDGNGIGFSTREGAPTRAKAMPSYAPVISHGPIVERTRKTLAQWAIHAASASSSAREVA
jgi:autotransporter passenger strand-loop-strand repeat protein